MKNYAIKLFFGDTINSVINKANEWLGKYKDNIKPINHSISVSVNGNQTVTILYETL